MVVVERCDIVEIVSVARNELFPSYGYCDWERCFYGALTFRRHDFSEIAAIHFAHKNHGCESGQ